MSNEIKINVSPVEDQEALAKAKAEEVKPEQPEVKPEVKPEQPEVKPEVKPEQPEVKPFHIGNTDGCVEDLGNGKFKIKMVIKKKDGSLKTVTFICSKRRAVFYLFLTFGVGAGVGALVTWLIMK